MKVRVLGEIELLGEHPVTLGGPNQRRILATLAIRRGAVVSVSSLVDVVWPDGRPPARADHNVRTYVHRLRGSLAADGERIETIGAGYRLNLDADELDAECFERRSDLANRKAEIGDTVGALDAIEQAERLWRGRPLEAFEDEPWAMPTAVRLRERRTSLSECKASVLIDVGRPAEAIEVLDELVRTEPLRETPRALLIRALYDAGRHTEALRAFRDFRGLLVEEIGIEPSSELIALDRSIATGNLTAVTSHTRRRIGGYELHEQIGEGAFAKVFRGTQPSLERDVAVKIVRAELANRPAFIRCFEAEAQTIARIEHANIVPLYDYWREPGQACLAMRLMTGGSLAQRLVEPWPIDDVVELVEQVASGLEAAHRIGVIHRDVKPENILFDAEGRAHLGDFGIALDAEQRWETSSSDTTSPAFAAPEQLRGEPVGPATDVHALAVVTFTVLAGRHPFADASDPATLRHRQLHEAIPSVRRLRPELHANVDAVLATGAAKHPVDRYPSALEFSQAFRKAVNGEADHAEHRPVDGTAGTNPFKGLEPFTEVDAKVFSGRERLLDELLTRATDPDLRLLAVVGPSGCGKSSVVRAGLIPALRADGSTGTDRWFITTMIPGTHPFEALEAALRRVAVDAPPALLDELQDGDGGLWRTARRVLPDRDGTVLIVIDQFEELFTSTVDEADRDHCLRALLVAVTEPSSPVRVILTLRADFFDRPLRHPTFATLMKRCTVAVAPLGPDELERAIVEPAATSGASFEPGLVPQIVADVNSQPGALPLMQFALTEAFEHSDGRTITVDDYRAIGGLTGAVAQRAEEVWTDATTAERVAMRRLFGRLVTLGEGREDTRRRVLRAELGDDAATEAMVERFGAARLLAFDRDPLTRQPTVEVAHEAVLREWPRLSSWLDEDRDTLRAHRHLTATSTAWDERQRDRAELYRGGRLASAEALRANPVVELNAREREFLDASVAQRTEDEATLRRRARRRWYLTAAMLVVAAMAVTFGLLAERQRQRADDQAEAAETNASVAAVNADLAATRADESESARQQAESERARADDAAAAAEEDRQVAEEATAAAEQQRLEAQAVAELDRDPTIAALLAVEAQRLGGSVSSASALHRVLTGTDGLEATIPGLYLGGRLSADGTKLVAFPLGAVDVWDLRDRTLVRHIEHGSAPGFDYDLTPDAGLVALTDTEGTYVVETATATLTEVLPEQVAAVALSPDGRRLATGGPSGVQLWDVSTPGAPEALDQRSIPSGVLDVAWNPTGDGYAVVTGTAAVEYWGRDAAAATWQFQPAIGPYGHYGEPLMLFAEDGRSVVVAAGEQQGVGEIIRTYSTEDGDLVHLEINSAYRLDGLSWIDDRSGLLGGSSLSSGAVAFDLVTATEIAPPVEVPGASGGFSTPLGRYVSISDKGIAIRALAGSGPLERVIELPPAQQAAINEGGAIYASVAADGRLISAVFQEQLRPETMVLDLDNAATWRPSPVPGLPTGAGSSTLMTLDQLVMLDAELQPVGEPVTTPEDTRQFEPSPDGQFFYVARLGGELQLYRSTGELVAAGLTVPEASPRDSFVYAGFSPDSTRLLGYATNSAWAMWDTETGALVDSGGIDRLSYPRFAGATLYAERLLPDFTVIQLDPDTYEPAGPALIGSGGVYPSYDDNLDGTLVAVTTGDGTTRVFDKATGTQLGREIADVGGVEFDADGTLMVWTREHISLWNYDVTTWSDLACQVAGRNLTRAEWEDLGPRGVEYRATCPQYPIDA